jgi:hypothetical protein
MTVYHVAPDGRDSNSGGPSDPFATFAPVSENGRYEVGSGDTIRVHGGTISIDEGETGVFWHADGLTVEAYGDDRPTIDASAFSNRSSSSVDSRPVLWFGRSENVTVRGLEIAYAPASPIKFEEVAMDAEFPFASIHDMKVGGHVVDCELHHCGLPLRWGKGRGGVAERVESYAHFGPTDESRGSVVGGDADGIQFTSGPDDAESHLGGAVIDCAMHHNSDDGLDLYRAAGIVVTGSVAYANGYRMNGESAGEAAGKGFKLGGTDPDFDTGGCLLLNSAAWGNGGVGIGFNGSNIANDVWNCTALDNRRKKGGGYDVECYTTDGPSGSNVDESTIYNTLAKGGINYFQTSLSDKEVERNNFDRFGTVRPDWSEFTFESVARDGAQNPKDWETFLRPTADSAAVDGGVPAPADTAGSRYYNVRVDPEYDGETPDIGAYQFEPRADEPDPEPEFSLDSAVVVDDAFVRRESDTPALVVGFRNTAPEPLSFEVPIVVAGERVDARPVSLGTLASGRLGRGDEGDAPVVDAVTYPLESDRSGTVRVGPVSFTFDASGGVVGN